MNHYAKKAALALTLSALTLSVSSCGQKGEVLNLYTWEGMFPTEVLSDFQSETGITVNYINFDYNETMLSKLEAANGGDYDVILADDYILEQAIQKNLVKPLDTEKLSNLGNINPVYQGQFYDPENKYTVPYGAGVQTIVYHPDKISLDIKGYADLWDTSLSDRVGVIANYRVIDGMALKVLGKSYNTENPDDIAEAGEKLNALAPNIRLIKDDYIEEDLISGEIDAAVMYTSQVTTALMADPTLKVVYPSEGIGFGIMGMFVPVNAPHADNAFRFLDYILDAEVSAQCFTYLGYYCTNSAAESLLSEEIKSYITLPDAVDMSTMEMIGTISTEADDAHAAVWTAFRALCD